MSDALTQLPHITEPASMDQVRTLANAIAHAGNLPTVPYHQAIETALLEDLIEWVCALEPTAHTDLVARLTPYLKAGETMPPIPSLGFLVVVCRLRVADFLDMVSTTGGDAAYKWEVRFGRYGSLSKSELASALLALERRLVAYDHDWQLANRVA